MLQFQLRLRAAPSTNLCKPREDGPSHIRPSNSGLLLHADSDPAMFRLRPRRPDYQRRPAPGVLPVARRRPGVQVVTRTFEARGSTLVSKGAMSPPALRPSGITLVVVLYHTGSATQHWRYSRRHAERGSQCTPSPTIDYHNATQTIDCFDVNTRNFGSPPGVPQGISRKGP